MSTRDTQKLSPEAIAFSRAVSRSDASTESDRLSAQGNLLDVVVLIFDIRRSTTFMLHTEDLAAYARILAQFVMTIRVELKLTNGWFDKFTGDGAIMFWHEPNLTAARLRPILAFAVRIQKFFLRELVPTLRSTGGALPANFGLAGGLDYGRCRVTDLGPQIAELSSFSGLTAGGMMDSATPRALDSIGPTPSALDSVDPASLRLNSVTVLGRAVVGAARLTSAAGPYQTLLSDRVGLVGESDPVAFDGSGFQLRRCEVNNKDLGLGTDGKQYAYGLRHATLDSLVAALTPSGHLPDGSS